MTAPLKSKLQSNTLTIGSWISLGHPGIAEILSRAGFDWLVIDMEHSTISISEAGELIRVIDLCGAAPLVRVTSNDADLIKRVMDAGAHGVIVPMVNSAADAARAVAATRYPPAGTRGVGMARAQRFGPTGFHDYVRWQHDGPTVIPQIEHAAAIDACAEILAVPGIDGFIIGPYDLSASLGIPGEFEHPTFTAALARTLAAGRAAGKPAGIHLVEPDPMKVAELVSSGYRMIAFSVDFRMLDVMAKAGLVAARGATR
jgi:2-keto-3-deoxy-L-rhamnonate aldolase RhmA